MIQTKTKTITSKDVSEAQKSSGVASVLGYKVHTVTMHTGKEDGILTKETFEAILKRVSRPLKQAMKEK